jgi:hypothetical protein
MVLERGKDTGLALRYLPVPYCLMGTGAPWGPLVSANVQPAPSTRARITPITSERRAYRFFEQTAFRDLLPDLQLGILLDPVDLSSSE